MLLEYFNAKMGGENIFKPAIGNQSLNEISNNNEVRVVNYATPENRTVKSTMFPHRNIHKSTDGKTHRQFDHILIDRRRLSSVLDVRSFRGVGRDTGERLAVSKQKTHSVHMERFNLKKLNEVEGTEQHRVEISNKLAALENLGTDVDIKRSWETVRENINISAKESLGCNEL
jgi:hypothetical protein